MAPRIPLVVIGGFLGAGKTTLLNHLLANTYGRKIAVLVNDFGAVNVDAELVAAHTGETLSLTNGCICCSIGSGLEDALIHVINRAPPLDLIVIEASGVSDPGRIAQVGLSDPALQLEAVIVLVDAERIASQLCDLLLGDTLVRQIRAASLLVLNKTDIVSRKYLNQTRSLLIEQFGTMAIVEAENAAIPLDMLLNGMDSQNLAAISDAGPVRWGNLVEQNQIGKLGNSSGHADQHADSQPDHPFEGGIWRSAGVLNADQFISVLKNLPHTVIRLKGWVTTDRHGPAIVHLAGGRVRVDRASQRTALATNELMYIGVRDTDIHTVVCDALAPLTVDCFR